jgi:hypothetical protein
MLMGEKKTTKRGGRKQHDTARNISGCERKKAWCFFLCRAFEKQLLCDSHAESFERRLKWFKSGEFRLNVVSVMWELISSLKGNYEFRVIS